RTSAWSWRAWSRPADPPESPDSTGSPALSGASCVRGRQSPRRPGMVCRDRGCGGEEGDGSLRWARRAGAAGGTRGAAGVPAHRHRQPARAGRRAGGRRVLHAGCGVPRVMARIAGSRRAACQGRAARHRTGAPGPAGARAGARAAGGPATGSRHAGRRRTAPAPAAAPAPAGAEPGGALRRRRAPLVHGGQRAGEGGRAGPPGGRGCALALCQQPGLAEPAGRASPGGGRRGRPARARLRLAPPPRPPELLARGAGRRDRRAAAGGVRGLPPVRPARRRRGLCAQRGPGGAVGVLAVLQDSRTLAVLGILAGFLAPLWLSSGSGHHVVLFSYYALLNAAILAVAWLRPWRELNLLGFVFTWGIGVAWGALSYTPAKYASTQPFLLLFFAFYLALPLLYARRRVPGRRDVVDASLVFGTPLVAFLLQGALLEWERRPLALCALALAALYAALAWWQRRGPHVLLGQAYALLAAGSATLAVPLALAASATSAVFAVEGAALVWLGVRTARALPQWSGSALQLGAAFAFVFGSADWPPAAAPFANPAFAGALLVAL